MKKIMFGVLLLAAVVSCKTDPKADAAAFQEEAQAFLDAYSTEYQKLYYASSKAEWELNTRIVEGDDQNAKRAEAANSAFAAFTGSEENINSARKYLERKEDLSDLQRRQFDAILYAAGANPATAADLVAQKIKAETAQTEMLFGHDFTLNGKSVSTNQLDSILESSNDLQLRLSAWEASKEVGKSLKKGLVNLRDLRNQTVQALGYKDYFSYQVSEYGMDSEEMVELNNHLIQDIWPLYRELHTWARYELAAKYGQPVPEMLPAHWLPNRWGQEWSSLVEVKGLDFNAQLREKPIEWITKQGEDFYISLGYDALPKSFFSKSSLYPLPPTAEYKKNNHASAWHMDLNNDLRSLMSIEPNMRWWSTVLHELGHIYYFQAYSRPEVPVLLRGGANRAYHEAIGTLIGLASMQKPFLVDKGLVAADVEVDKIQGLLKEALDYVVVMPWASGVMTDFEYDLYANGLAPDQFNARWWALKKQFQGIVPPTERDEEYCDAASKTHINNDAAQYYDYALANAMLFQFHMHISQDILQQDPHETNYYGSKETGMYLKELMAPGATVDWRDLLSDEITGNAINEYFAPLMDWLQEQNKDRAHTLPDAPF